MATLPRTDHNVLDLSAIRGEGGGAHSFGSVPILDTSELRWFASGPLPLGVIAWFTCDGTLGTIEERTDVYQLHRLHDIGVKRRARDILEVKVRRSIGDDLAVTAGLAAPFEEWRKWSPFEGDPMTPSPDIPWIDVRKAVITRTFLLPDHEVVGPAPHVDDSLSGCDVEIAAVNVGGLESWTFGFEAFGPKSNRRRTVASSWDKLVAESGGYEHLGSHFQQAAGYPEWLAASSSTLQANSAADADRLTG
jgi:hypothetical protein